MPFVAQMGMPPRWCCQRWNVANGPMKRLLMHFYVASSVIAAAVDPVAVGR